jgi:hypothetical protein
VIFSGAYELLAHYLDERSLAVLDGTAHQDDDPLPLVLVLPVLESKLRREHTRVSVKPKGRLGNLATDLSDLDSRHQIRLAARLETVQRGSDFAFVGRQCDQDFGSGG